MTNAFLSVNRNVSRELVERELAKILASDLFGGNSRSKGLPMLSPLLAYLVTESLEGQTPTNDSLLTDFFKRKLNSRYDDPLARQNIRNLRRKLLNYYADEGATDAVIIGIPFGQYRAEFEHSSRTPAQNAVKLGLFHLARETFVDVQQACWHFVNAMDSDPSLSDAHAGYASILVKGMEYFGAADGRLQRQNQQLSRLLNSNRLPGSRESRWGPSTYICTAGKMLNKLLIKLLKIGLMTS